MEPIRPDKDELRAETPAGAAEARAPRGGNEPGVGNGGSRPPAASGGRPGGKGGGRMLVWVAILGLGVVAGVGWYGQGQRIAVLESQLEEADYWARQSKLALARFEGELSETGESLQERGASLDEKIAANAEKVGVANSEIRKLWVVANERNRKKLDEHGQRLSVLEQQLAETGKSVSDLATTVDKVQTGLGDDIAQLGQRLDTSLPALEQADRKAESQLAELSRQIGDVDQVVEGRLRRFEQEQALGMDGVESRLSALEARSESLAGASDVRALQNRLAELARTVESIDASRAQLTSRLVRLSEEVNQLRASGPGQ
ncbi:hypothetical protein [Marinobacter sp. VGCF2001]|uniref:hypothetical protein n=1 Tax=Marinobacter sp. VGCF2001 TaxID=3417189 RepID=UPI003CECB2ED